MVLKELSLTLLKRANSSSRSQKTPAVTLFGHFDFTCEEPGTVQKRIEFWTVLTDTIALNISYCKVAGRELGENSTPTPPPPPPPPPKPSHSDNRLSTDPVHALKDLKMANMWTVFLNTSWNQPRIAHPKMGQIIGSFPVLIISDPCHPRKPD